MIRTHLVRQQPNHDSVCRTARPCLMNTCTSMFCLFVCVFSISLRADFTPSARHALHCTALPDMQVTIRDRPGERKWPPVHCTALYCTALHCTALHCTALHYAYCPELHRSERLCNSLLYCPAMHWSAVLRW